jgi:hypothetical protein
MSSMEGGDKCERCPAQAELNTTINILESNNNDPDRLERINNLQEFMLKLIETSPELCPGPSVAESDQSVVCPIRTSINTVRYMVEGPLPPRVDLLPTKPNGAQGEQEKRPGNYL